MRRYGKCYVNAAVEAGRTTLEEYSTQPCLLEAISNLASVVSWDR